MKAFSKLGPGKSRSSNEASAAYGSEAPWDDAPAVREPAPAGALQRNYPSDFPETEDDVQPTPDDTPFVSPRARVGFRVRGAMRSTLGRVVVGTIAAGILGVTAASAWTIHRFLLHDERFVIPTAAHIETSGNVHLTRAQLLSVFGEDVERNIFRVPLAQRRADLESIPWVQHATVMRLLPNTLRISIEERTPVAFFRQGTQIGLVDASGVLLQMASTDAGNPQYSFPVVRGLSAEDPLSTRAARMELYTKFMQEIDGSGPRLSTDISDVDVSNPEDIKIQPENSSVLVHLGDEEFLHRYNQFRAHIGEWKQQYPHLFAADMRYDHQVVLEPAPGTSAMPTETAALTTPPSPAAAKPIEHPTAKAPTKPGAPLVTAPSSRVGGPSIPRTTPKPGAPSSPTAPSSARVGGPNLPRTTPKPSTPAPETKPHAGAHPANASGVSTSNAKMFAALAAARKAQMEQSKQPQTRQGPK